MDQGPDKRVLLVDDDEELRTSLARHLRRAGIEIHLAEDGPQGLAALRLDPRVAVIVSDLRMPGMDGITFLDMARRIAPGARGILMTAHADVRAAERAVNEARVRLFLRKPFEFEELARQVRSLLAEQDAELARWRALATAFSTARP